MASTAKGADFAVNNEVYHDLGERWYTAKDDPIALLRAEGRVRTPWVIGEIRRHFGTRAASSVRILDVGCGAGMLANVLVREGWQVTGLDASSASLEIAAAYDTTSSVIYDHGDATRLPYADAQYDVVCAMDFLEHVPDPAIVVHEAARVLRPGGLFFFHTFNRNPIAWLIGIKGVEWFVRNVPHNLHQIEYFIKPRELRRMCEDAGLTDIAMHGLAPDMLRAAFWKMLVTGCVEDDFRFVRTKTMPIGYSGVARKKG